MTSPTLASTVSPPLAQPDTTAGTTPLAARGWTPARQRRARMFAVLLAAGAAVALFSAFQPWFAWATSGPASCSRAAVPATVSARTSDDQTVSGIYAAGCVSGRQLVVATDTSRLTPAQSQALALLSQRATVTAAPPAALLGLPRSVTLTVAFSLLAVLAVMTLNGWIGLVAILGLFVAHRDLGALETWSSSGTGGSLNVPQSGLSLFSWALLLCWALTFTATVFIVRHNSGQRALDTEAALAEGRTPPMGPSDHLLAFVGGKVAKVMDGAAAERTKRDDRERPVR
jgi:UPF0716 family protein affecting phage T7 exclusion